MKKERQLIEIFANCDESDFTKAAAKLKRAIERFEECGDEADLYEAAWKFAELL